jgi:hypothetical protein
MAGLCHHMPETHTTEKSDRHIRWHQGRLLEHKRLPLGHGEVEVYSRQQVDQPVVRKKGEGCQHLTSCRNSQSNQLK